LRDDLVVAETGPRCEIQGAQQNDVGTC
jgi:hypothetical protein